MEDAERKPAAPPQPPPESRYVLTGDGTIELESPALRRWNLIRQIVLSTVPLVFGLAFLVLLAHEVRRDALEIARIEVPARLVEAGLTPEVVARRLGDHLERAARPARAESAMRPSTEIAGAQPDISVPVAGLSLRAVAGMVRDMLDLPQREISGEILLLEDKLSIRLRVSGHGEVADLGGFAPGEVEAMLAAAAPEAWRVLQPQVYAWHIAETVDDQEEVRRRLAALRGERTAADSVAYLTGQSLLRSGLPEEALGIFQALTRTRPDYAQGWYGSALALHALERCEPALAMLRRAVALHGRTVWTHLFEARLLSCLERYEEAAREIAAGRRLDGENVQARALEIELLGRLGRHREAVAAAEAWQAERPELAESGQALAAARAAAR